ncbi:MAG: cob(I)yrinic acid a,c-diamide adenosyltransferase [candidate division WOR-3 bacterium]
MIQVYTGDGKGKTTAAIGQAIRALGHNFKVLMIQFMKGDKSYGEIVATKDIPNFEIRQFGLPTFVKKGEPSPEDIRLAQEGLNFAKKALQSNQYQMIILDEINVAIDYGLVKLAEVLELIKICPKSIELVLTGRYAPKELIDLADLVSEIKEIKHPYTKGYVSREGIDY